MRLLGLSLAFLGPFLLGVASAVRGDQSRKRERAMLGLMLHGEEKIRRTLCSRDELFVDFENESLSRCGFLNGLKAAGRNGTDPLEILNGYKEELGLSEKTFSCCQRYFSRLGKLGYESQLSFCRACREEAEAALGEIEKKGREQIKLSVTLGAAAGAFAVILLL